MDIRTYRAQHGLKLVEFAAMVGTTAATVSRWERFKHPPTLQSIARVEKATKGLVCAADFMPGNRPEKLHEKPRFVRSPQSVPESCG